MVSGGFSTKGLTRVRDVVTRHVDSGFVPGAVAVIAHGDEVHLETVGTLSFDGSSPPMAADTIWRSGSMSKPIVAACAMTFVEDCTLRLDDPVDDLLPELADMRVLADPGGPLEDTVPANRPITLRDLLTFRLGTGMVLDESPIAQAIDALEDRQATGLPDALPADEWVARLGSLPLVYQPGERWQYDIGSNVLAVLLARATGTTVGEAIRARICEPLGMADTGFRVDDDNLGRFATGYAKDGDGVVDDPPDGRWNQPTVLEECGGGIVTTAADYLAFATALLRGGGAALSRRAVTLMTTDHLTPAQKAVSGFWPGYFDEIGWGLGVSVRTRLTQLGPSVGSYGWTGFWGTAWYNDPTEDLTVMFVQQRAHAGIHPSIRDVLTAAYAALD